MKLIIIILSLLLLASLLFNSGLLKVQEVSGQVVTVKTGTCKITADKIIRQNPGIDLSEYNVTDVLLPNRDLNIKFEGRGEVFERTKDSTEITRRTR